VTLYRTDIKLQWAKSDLLARVNALCDAKMTTIKAGYPEEEVKTWDQQVREALLHQTDPAAAAPMVASLAAKRGLSKEEMASKIMVKAAAFADLAGQIIGHRQVVESAVEACTTRAALDTVDIDTGWPI